MDEQFYPAVDGVPTSRTWRFRDTVNGNVSPIIRANYGEPIVVRNWNRLPSENGGFGVTQTTTHLHNGHTASESDGGPVDFYDAGKFKDYHYPNVRAGFASAHPGLGDTRETMSFPWFHDHRFDFTAANVYKGVASMYLLFSADAAFLGEIGNAAYRQWAGGRSYKSGPLAQEIRDRVWAVHPQQAPRDPFANQGQ